MLDIQFIRENAEIVRQAAIDKQLDPAVVDRVLELDGQRRELIPQVEAVRQNSNELQRQIKGRKPTEEELVQGRALKEQLKELEPRLREVEAQFEEALYWIPNVPAEDVPVGPDETANQVIKTVGEKPSFGFQPKTHSELLEAHDLLNTKKAAEIAGTRAYYLRGKAMLLEQALLQYALQFMVKKGFTPMSVPLLVNQTAFLNTGYGPWGMDDFFITQDGQGLIGTAEVPVTAYYQGEVLREDDLPIKMVGLSSCFRREVGSYGKDTKGVFRVHSFNKVEQVVYTVANENITREWHDTMLGFAEELLQSLGLHYQVLLMCTGDMGAGQRRKYDIETWFPGEDRFRETHSDSYFNDFQARRLNIRYQAKDGSLKYVYTLNNTVAATPRLMAAVVENYQTEDGDFVIPEVLKPYFPSEA